jgi:hypothetical protein
MKKIIQTDFLLKYLLIAALGSFLCLTAASKIRANQLISISPELKEELAYTTGVQALIYSYPLVHINHFRYLFHAPASPMYMGPANALGHSRQLSSSSKGAAATPNNDTLYTLAFLDLSQPVIFDVPEMGNRYYTIQLADAYATNFGDIGTRHNNGEPGKYMLVGPDWSGETPAGVTQVFRSPTPWATTLLRVLVDNQKELEGVHAKQDAFKLTTVDGMPLPPLNPALLPGTLEPLAALPVVDGVEASQFWSIINRELTANPPPVSDKALVDQFALVGIGPGQPQDLSQLDPAIKKGLIRAAKTGMELISAVADDISGGRSINGWGYARADIGRYGTDYLYRAGVTRMGLIANDPIESTYLSLYADADGNELRGSANYRLHFPAGNLPPARAFWSITMYDRETFRLVDNIIERFSIGDRTAGLKYNDDGALDVYIGNAIPDRIHTSNWLPAPAEGFYLVMRVYIPEDSVVQQLWEPPALELLPAN